MRFSRKCIICLLETKASGLLRYECRLFFSEGFTGQSNFTTAERRVLSNDPVNHRRRVPLVAVTTKFSVVVLVY